MKKYFQEFSTVEIQSTFYKHPKLETLRKWKEMAPNNFQFSIKAFQGITHPTTSPTWKRYGEIKIGKPENYGLLQTTEEVFNSWNQTLEICKILQAKICLIQLPASFKDDEINLENSRKFFSKIKRNNLEIAVELRGWSIDNIERICRKFNLIDCCDPFVRLPNYFKDIAYFRLHGSYEKGRINYKHKYSEKELEELRKNIINLKVKETFILFNNLWMFEDAKAFLRLISL